MALPPRFTPSLVLRVDASFGTRRRKTQRLSCVERIVGVAVEGSPKDAIPEIVKALRDNRGHVTQEEGGKKGEEEEEEEEKEEEEEEEKEEGEEEEKKEEEEELF